MGIHHAFLPPLKWLGCYGSIYLDETFLTWFLSEYTVQSPFDFEHVV